MSLQYALLGLLTYNSMTGYELKSVFDNSVNHFWEAQLSQIYRDLGTLERKGLVSHQIVHQEGKPNKKVYTITTDGCLALNDWLKDAPKKISSTFHDEISVRVFFGSRLTPSELINQLKQYRDEVKERIASLSLVEQIISKKAEMCPSGEDFFWRLTLNKGYTIYRAELEWAEASLKELNLYKKRSASK